MWGFYSSCEMTGAHGKDAFNYPVPSGSLSAVAI